MHAVGRVPNMLAEIFNRPPVAGTEYPPVIWKYLNTPDHRNPEKLTPKESLFQLWVTSGRLSSSWPATPGSEYRLLRKGTNEWTCLPAIPGYPHDEPGRFDPVFLQWIKDSLAGKQPHIDRIGISYMYSGAWVPNNSGKERGGEFRVGPHIMIVGPHQFQDELCPLSHDGSNGMPYVAHLPNGTDLYLVLPIRQWDEN